MGQLYARWGYTCTLLFNLLNSKSAKCVRDRKIIKEKKNKDKTKMEEISP